MSVKKVSGYSVFKTRIRKGYRSIKFSSREKACYNECKSKAIYSETKPFLWGMKRVVDVVGSALGMLVSAPILAVSAAAIKLDSKGPVLFIQKRIGKDGKPFDIYKLRTMYNNPKNSSSNVRSADDKRITRVGKILRKYSIDETPQFYNIFRGDMSLVGPRPLPYSEHLRAKDYPEFSGRYAIRPGICLEYNKYTVDNPRERFPIERDYIENWSPKKDVKVLWSLAKNVLTGKNY